MQPIGCGLLPPGDSVKKFSAFKGLEERHRRKMLLPLGLPPRILSAKALRRFVAFLREGSSISKSERKISCIHSELGGRNYMQNCGEYFVAPSDVREVGEFPLGGFGLEVSHVSESRRGAPGPTVFGMMDVRAEARTLQMTKATSMACAILLIPGASVAANFCLTSSLYDDAFSPSR